jgi:MoxR-like ATPase
MSDMSSSRDVPDTSAALDEFSSAMVTTPADDFGLVKNGAKKLVHVEICIRDDSPARFDAVSARVRALLNSSPAPLRDGLVDLSGDQMLQEHVEFCRIGVTAEPSCFDTGAADVSADHVLAAQADLRLYCFQLSSEAPVDEHAEDEDSSTTMSQWTLPSRQLDGVWPSLIFDGGVKQSLLEYASTSLLFADAGVSSSIVPVNRVVLLHGPPGTGKTSLCRGLAQKLSVRHGSRYQACSLLEINAHSLFSRWFSESGKLVMRLFDQIHEMVEDEEALVMVLIDEVESLSAARRAAMGGAEPSDAIRVVNALLTQVDRLSRRPNVLVLTTSNITDAIDVAFVDRADIKQYIGLPGLRARFEILRTCVNELSRAGIVRPAVALPGCDAQALRELDDAGKPRAGREASGTVGSQLRVLLHAAQLCEGLSGRALRKLPFQAHVYFVRRPHATCKDFLAALVDAARLEKAQRSKLATG